MPKRQGHVYCPGPPLITRVCRESRQVALKNGSPRSFDRAEKCGSTGWFDPSRDVVVWSLAALSRQNSICPSLWPAVTCISILYEGKPSTFTEWVDQFLSQGPTTRLKSIDVLQSRGYAANIGWGPDLLHDVFGERSALIIDLEAKNEVERIVRALRSDRKARGCLTALHNELDKLLVHQKAWTKIAAKIKKHWLKETYKSGVIQVLGSRPEPRLPETYDGEGHEDTEWVQVAMRHMPRIRPAFLIYKKQGDLISLPNRSRGERYPQVQFHDGNWERKEKRKRSG